MRRRYKWLLIITVAPPIFIAACWLLLVYRVEFFVHKPRACSWVSLTNGMRFEAESYSDQLVTTHSNLVFRQSSEAHNDYIFAAIAWWAEENSQQIYSNPKYRLSLIGPTVTISSDEEWKKATPIETADSQLGQVDESFQAKLAELEEKVTGKKLYEASEVVSPDGRSLLLISHTPWYRSLPIWAEENHGMVFWEAFDLVTLKKLSTVAAVFCSIGASDAKGKANWLPGGALVISPEGDRKRLLVCKTH